MLVVCRSLLILVLLSLSALFLDLGGRRFISEDEGRFAEIGREIAVSNDPADWVIQKLNDEVYARKPPLYPALVAASYLFWGEFNEFAAAFPSAFFAFLTLLVCYFSWRRIFGEKTALIAAVILVTTFKFVDQARAVQVDTVMNFFIVSSLFCGYFYLEESPRRWHWAVLFFVSCAFATLTKGPVGLVLPLLVVGLAVVIRKKWRELFSLPVLCGIALFSLLMGLWLLLIHELADPLYFFELFFRQSFLRYVDAFDHEAGPLYYFPAFAVDFLPWTPFFLAVIFLPKWRKNETGKPLVYFWIWFLAVFFFFTLSGSKRSLYLLPLYPAAALLVGNGWSNQKKAWQIGLAVYAVLFAIFCPITVDKIFDRQEKRSGNQIEQIKEMKLAVGGAPLQAYRMMEPSILFYMRRTVPEMRELKEIDLYMGSKEKVFLLIDGRSEPELTEELNKKYRLIQKLNFKKDRYFLFANRD